jgi:hypothetical protein
LKICIDLPGNISNGLWSSERGESRWAQNWANLLAINGHDVCCIAHPGEWGSCPPVSGVTLVSANRVCECDIYMNACWWLGREINDVKAKCYVHLHFGYESHLADSSHIKSNHVIAYPFLRDGRNFLTDRNPFTSKTFCLPVPMAKSFGGSHFNNSEPWWFNCGKSAITAMKEEQDKSGVSCNFFCNEQLRPGSFKSLKEYGISNLLDTIKNKTMYGQMTYDKAKEVLDRSKMTIPIIDVGGSTLDSVILGVLPLAWDGSLFEDPAKKSGWILSHRASESEIRNNISLAMSNNDMYDSLLSSFQKEAQPYLYDNCMTHFGALVDWVKNNC